MRTGGVDPAAGLADDDLHLVAPGPFEQVLQLVGNRRVHGGRGDGRSGAPLAQGGALQGLHAVGQPYALVAHVRIAVAEDQRTQLIALQHPEGHVQRRVSGIKEVSRSGDPKGLRHRRALIGCLGQRGVLAVQVEHQDVGVAEARSPLQQ